MADDDVLFQNGMGNLKVAWVFGVHFDAVDQFVAIGELLLGKLLFAFRHRCSPSLRKNSNLGNSFPSTVTIS